MNIEINNKYFHSEHKDRITILHIDFSLFLESESFDHRNALLGYLDSIDKHNEVKTLVINNDHPNFSLAEYKDKWDSIYQSDDYEANILRIFRTFNQVFLKLKSMQKVTIAVYTKPTNAMLFSFSMCTDLRFVSLDFYIDNDNHNFVNIPKGGAAFIASNLIYVNPVKMLFQADKVYPTDLYKKHIVDETCNQEALMNRAITVATRYSKFDYIELESVKIVEHKRIKNLDIALQEENEYLLTCIRKKKNSKGEHLPRIK